MEKPSCLVRSIGDMPQNAFLLLVGNVITVLEKGSPVRVAVLGLEAMSPGR